MATGSDFERICLSLPSTTHAPHFDRTAFKVRRIFATLAADRRTANLKLTPDEQAFKLLLVPEAFVAIDNAWGRQGWTTAMLEQLSTDELRAALELAWAHGAARR